MWPVPLTIIEPHQDNDNGGVVLNESEICSDVVMLFLHRTDVPLCDGNFNLLLGVHAFGIRIYS